MISDVASVDLSGDNIKTTLQGLGLDDLASIVDSADTFRSGAAYLTGKSTWGGSDIYELNYWTGDCLNPTASGNCGFEVNWSGIDPVPYTSLDQLIIATAWVDDGFTWSSHFLWLGDVNTVGFKMELVGSGSTGTVNYYTESCDDISCTLTKLVETDSWNIINVNGASLLYIDHQNDALMAQYGYDEPAGANTFYAVNESVVVRGYHFPVAVSEPIGDGDFISNKIAQDDVLSAIDPALIAGLTVPPAPPAATLTCGYESGWDDLVDGGLGAPVEAQSFDAFEGLLADCGTALSFTAADVAGASFVVGTETTTFGNTGAAATLLDPETGIYDDGAGFTAPIIWYVEDASCAGCTHSYVVTYTDETIDPTLPAGFWFRGTAAVTAITGTPGVAGSSYTFYHYDEQSNYSDADRGVGIDGDIWVATETLQ